MKRDTSQDPPEVTSDGREWVVWASATAVFVVALAFFRSALTDTRIHSVMCWVGAATAFSAVTGALAGALAAQLGLWRVSGVRMRDRLAWSTCLASGTVGLFSVLVAPTELTSAALLGAAGAGAIAGVVAQHLSLGHSPTYYYALALLRQRRGNRDGACEAIGSYLLLVHRDPDSATRRPIAERFLRDAGASLEVPTELLTAEPPAGRGTEPEHAPAPVGRGTEMEPASPPAREKGGRP